MAETSRGLVPRNDIIQVIPCRAGASAVAVFGVRVVNAVEIRVVDVEMWALVRHGKAQGAQMKWWRAVEGLIIDLDKGLVCADTQPNFVAYGDKDWQQWASLRTRYTRLAADKLRREGERVVYEDTREEFLLLPEAADGLPLEDETDAASIMPEARPIDV